MALNLISKGEIIRKMRKKRDLSQEQLAEKVNITPTYVSLIENGYKCMSLELFVAIANALNISADELLVESLVNTVKVSNHEFSTLLDDCSEYEKRILRDVLLSTKESLRSNKHLYRRK